MATTSAHRTAPLPVGRRRRRRTRSGPLVWAATISAAVIESCWSDPSSMSAPVLALTGVITVWLAARML
ncbi:MULTISPECIES: hypothetical protein [unclassified Saccharopolyspora]|uniref:hypothetical protein n=1 Tax=unclassified Saccharopolyspora TaxID=2646250 RepID=UPI001CD7B5E1|nr:MULTISPECIES: hypothetical protein [unclassified Saccharopolyspora]MCA1185077.1 hypothetical protein [Saccharopolyspora sp. 6T]MCA1191443.1 hypothetical protein [Saccharopolyspora sp. 6V]MCA1224952.1 hypothetical protein [Saccharopolyspora sp. 6M]MCA1278557.1 hypothetical protein [Saccharopolyspora sp. 7B]